jgi:hypothetical protein
MFFLFARSSFGSEPSRPAICSKYGWARFIPALGALPSQVKEDGDLGGLVHLRKAWPSPRVCGTISKEVPTSGM